MVRYIGLLRAVNVGTTWVRMDALRSHLEALGCSNVRTPLQSGNVVFDAPAGAPTELERRLEVAASKSLGVSTVYFLRTRPEWDEVIAANPFPREARDDPARLVVATLKGSPGPDAWRRLDSAIVGRESARPGARHAYLYYPDGQGRSKLTSAVIERTLGVRSTSRNWNTVQKLAALAAA